MFERIKHMLIKEFLQTFRDPNMKRLLIVAPVLQILIFSYAMASDVDHIAMAVYDLDQTPKSRALISDFVSSGYFFTTGFLTDETQVKETLDTDEVQMILQINHGFEATLESGKTAPIQVLLDGTDLNTATIVLAYAARIVQNFGTAQVATQTAKNGRILAGQGFVQT